MAFQALPGFRDFYPEEMALRRHVENAWHAAAKAAGFEEVDGPPLESLELLTAKSGEAIVEELYAFTDKGGREVALRAELTPTVARMIAARAAALKKPVKWYAVPQLFRYQRQQRGRLKEHIQWNADIFGASEIGADAEVLAVAIDALQRLGLDGDDIYVRLSHRAPIEALLTEVAPRGSDIQALLRLIDKEDLEGLRAAGVDPSAWGGVNERIEEACSGFFDACEDAGIREYVQVDSTVVRGLAYYTGIVWEIFDKSRRFRAVAGGGRYDTLVERMGGPPMSAVGFGMGDVVLSELLKDLGKAPHAPSRVDILVVPTDAEMVPQARRLVRRLRDNMQRAEASFAPLKRNKAMNAAKAAGAKRVYFVGEMHEGKISGWDLENGKEVFLDPGHV